MESPLTPFLFYMIGFLRTLCNHCPCLFYSPLDMRTRSPRWHWTFPIGHLSIMARCGFESLKRLVEARAWLYGTVRVLGSVSWVCFGLAVVRKIWLKHRILSWHRTDLRGRGVHLSVRCVCLWTWCVLVAGRFIPKRKNIVRFKFLGYQGKKHTTIIVCLIGNADRPWNILSVYMSGFQVVIPRILCMCLAFVVSRVLTLSQKVSNFVSHVYRTNILFENDVEYKEKKETEALERMKSEGSKQPDPDTHKESERERRKDTTTAWVRRLWRA